MNVRAGNTTWQVNIDRVVITGVTPGLKDTGVLRALIEQRIAGTAAAMVLPPGRTMRASVALEARSLSNAAAIANAVSDGVSQALGGARRA